MANPSTHPENKGDRNPARAPRLRKEAQRNLKRPAGEKKKPADPEKPRKLEPGIQQANTVTDGEDG